MRRRPRPTDLVDDREARELTEAFITPLRPESPREHDSTPVSQETVEALATRVAQLEERLLAQFSAMAAYATIAQQAVETARAEARSDLDRARHTILGLIDQLHRETRQLGGEPVADGSAAARLDELAAAVEQIARDHHELAARVAALVEHRMAGDGWLASGGDPRALTLH